jgi:4'-phosphopantetheinyl transferase
MNFPNFEVSCLSTEVHVYCLDISEVKDNNYIDLLDDDEKNRAEKFRFSHHQTRFVAAHGSMRKIFIHYLQDNPVILQMPHGKPFLKDYPHIQFNLSHSKNKALLALTLDVPLGIDLEYMRKNPDMMGIAKRFFSAAEAASLQHSPNMRTLFYQLWTRKEAYLKLKGVGISSGNEGLEQDIPAGYLIHDFQPAPDYTAALVLPAVNKTVRNFI